MSERDHLEQAAGAIRTLTRLSPAVGVILGSGLGSLAGAVRVDVAVSYAEIPHFPVSTIPGHAGRLVVGRMEDRIVAILQGRAHLYEGYTAAQVAFPVRVLAALGARVVLVTNAAGGINRTLHRGDLMIITDQINLTGTNPLIGPNDDGLGPRFPDMSAAYDPDLVLLVERLAGEEGIILRRGIYAGLSGPSFETPAEVEMLARLGADAVGMSTVVEVIGARHAGLRVAGLSAITNAAAGRFEAGAERASPPAHEAVLRVAGELAPRIIRLVRGVLRQLPA